MLWLLAREGDDCLPICEGDDGDCFLAALGAGAVPILAVCCTPTLMLAKRATAHPSP